MKQKQWDENDLDRLLDRTLSEYASEPRAGLEQRVLANLAGAQARPRRWWIWAAVPLFAAIVVAVLVWATQQQRVIEPPVFARVPSAPEVTKQTVARAVAHVRKAAPPSTIVGRAAAAPKLPTFPSQTDDTQVRLALRFVQNNPALAQQVVKEEKEFEEATARNFGLDRQNGSETQ